MGFLDKAKDLLAKNSDKVDSAIDKAGDLVDKRTQGKYASHVNKVQDAAKKGVKTIINLCPLEETPPNEASSVQALGMAYFNIPIRSAQDLTIEAARQLAEVMDDCERHPVLVHCRSANRVGALMALKEYWFGGKSAAEAMATGRNAGLTIRLSILTPEWPLILGLTSGS